MYSSRPMTAGTTYFPRISASQAGHAVIVREPHLSREPDCGLDSRVHGSSQRVRSRRSVMSIVPGPGHGVSKNIGSRTSLLNPSGSSSMLSFALGLRTSRMQMSSLK